MTPPDAFTRRRLLKLIKEVTTAMGEQEYTDDALDALVHDCFAEQAAEVNNSGRPAQLEHLLKNGWTPEDILGRLRIQKEEAAEEEDES